MNVHIFGNCDRPVMLLVHGMLTPWQIFTPMIEAFSASYCVYVIALDAHVEETASEFVGLDEEASEIERIFSERHIQEIAVACGISLGGVIVNDLFRRGNLDIGTLIFDGAPLLPMPKCMESMMTFSYKRILRRSKMRDPATLKAFSQHFLPTCYLQSYLSFIDTMSERSLENCVHAASSGSLENMPTKAVPILFLHGTALNELWAQRSARRLQRLYPQTEVICFKKTSHCQVLVYDPRRWIDTVRCFINQSENKDV